MVQIISQPLTTDKTQHSAFANGVRVVVVLPRDMTVAVRPFTRQSQHGFMITGVELLDTTTQAVVGAAWRVDW